MNHRRRLIGIMDYSHAGALQERWESQFEDRVEDDGEQEWKLPSEHATKTAIEALIKEGIIDGKSD